MGGFVEGFTNVMVSNNSEEEKRKLYSLMIYVLLMKLVFIFIVSQFLWSRVVPDIFPGVNPNPSFLQLVGLSITFSLLM